MPQSSGPVIGYCIKDTAGRKSVEYALRCEAIAGLVLSRAALSSGSDSELRWCDAILYDLSPWTQTAITTVMRLRAKRPLLPILLYPPLDRDAFPIAVSCGSIRGVNVLLQQEDGSTFDDLRSSLRMLLDRASLGTLERLVALLVKDQPEIVRRFCSSTLQIVSNRSLGRSISVDAIAVDLKRSRRTIDRLFQRDGAMPPKSLLDWVLLLCVSFRASQFGLSFTAAAKASGIDRQRIYRTRQRLLSGQPLITSQDANATFIAVFVAFANLMGVSEKRATTLMLKKAEWS